MENSSEEKTKLTPVEEGEKEKKKLSKFKKVFLYLTGFFCGMSVMAIELGASRLMSPYFSSSQIVYTIIIGTVMIAMAIGNILGGKMADKNKEPTKLFVLIFIAAVWIALIPVLGKYIIAGVSLLLAASSLSSNFLIVAAFLSCFLVFVFPLLVLGMVTPNLVKYAVGSLEENGKVVGTIEALNTIGSIIGTFLPTFVTIPYIGTSWTFIIFSIVLFVICLIYFFMKHYRRIFHTSFMCLILVVSIIFSSGTGMVFWQSNTLYEGESIYNYLRVEETSDSIVLSTNVLFGVQSIKKKKDGLTGMYYDYAMAADYMAGKEEDLDILILGLGTGTFAYQSELYYGKCNIDGVEIDEKIVELARKYFSLPEDVNAYVYDGRAYIEASKKKYDVIMVDAYQDITIPFYMSSVEFFKEVYSHLNDDGVMVVNMNMYTSNEGGINDYLCGTIRSIFPSAYGAITGTNYELFATKEGVDAKKKLEERIPSIKNSSAKAMMQTVDSKLNYVPANSYILTDDKAPVELLGMSVLDDMIFTELDYYRAKLEGKSIQEIIEMLLNGELF